MNNRDTQAAINYHDGTRHPGGHLMNPHHRFHPAQQPLLFKVYEDLPAIPLPLEPPPSLPSALDAISGTVGARQEKSFQTGSSSLASPLPAPPIQAGQREIPDLPAIARLLHYSAGITKYIQYPEPWGRIPFRAAACTGALYHIEIYLVCGDLPPSDVGARRENSSLTGQSSLASPLPASPLPARPLPASPQPDPPLLEAGVYHYDPQASALRRLRQGDYRRVLVEASGGEPSIAAAPAILVLTDVFWRNAVKYQAREYRHAFWDSGTILANTLAVAAAEGLPARVVLGFVDEEVSRLLDLSPGPSPGSGGERDGELVLGLVAVGAIPGQLTPPAPPVTPLALDLSPDPSPGRGREPYSPTIRVMHAASSLPDTEAVSAWRSERRSKEIRAGQENVGARQGSSGPSGRTSLASPPPASPILPLQPIPDGELPAGPVDKVIVRRGSTRKFAREAIGFQDLSTLLERSLRGIDFDFASLQERPAPESARLSLTVPYLIVNAVEGLGPGAYVYHTDLESLELLKAGDFRDAAGYLALHQDLAADASLNIYFLADLQEALERFGNRGYRAAQLEAAICAGRLYLAAYALGLGASGLTFFDDAVTEFFSPHAEGMSVMFLIAIGKKWKRKP